MQVIVDVVNVPGAAFQGSRLYTYLRDELGTVIGLVAEDEGVDPEKPPVPVRYSYKPYGDGHAETGPELRRVRFDNGVTQISLPIGALRQEVSDTSVSAEGALRVSLSVPVSELTLDTGVAIERLSSGGWTLLNPADLILSTDPGEPTDLLILTRSGWIRGDSYRVRLTRELADLTGRGFAEETSLEWSVPTPTSDLTGGVGVAKRLAINGAKMGARMGRAVPRHVDEVSALARRGLDRPPSGRSKLSVGDDLRRMSDLDTSKNSLKNDGVTTCRIGGKCFTGDTLVLTAEGLTPIEEIEVGDRVMTSEESPANETAVDATWKVVRVQMDSAENPGESGIR